MSRQQLRIQQRFGLLDKRQQYHRWNPHFSSKNALDRLGQFRLPGSMKLDEAIYAPIEQPQFLGVTGVTREKNQKLAARRMRAASRRKRSQVGMQRTRVQKEQ